MNENTNKVLLSEVKVGETINTGIGAFIVLEQTEEGAKVITKDLFETMQHFGSSPDYKGSDLQQLCEGKIYDAFAKEFGAENIVEHEVDLITVDMQQDYGKVNCRVRPLTFDEVRKYNNMLVNPELSDWWWTCTSWSIPERGWRWSGLVVSPSGFIDHYFYYNDFGVRPVCILKSNIFVSKKGESTMLKMELNKTFKLAGLQWTVLEQLEEGFLCIAESIGNRKFGENNDWKESDIRKYLNTEFYEKLVKEIGEDAIQEFERNLLSHDGQKEYGTCMDKVSMITVDEYRKYRELLPNTGKWLWTITPDSTPCNDDDRWITVGSPSGNVIDDGYRSSRGVRPVCIFSSAIFESEE